MTENEKMTGSFYPVDSTAVLASLSADQMLDILKKMLLVRTFELRAEGAYQAGNVGGFFHSYIGQEAIQTALLFVCGPHHWYSCSYRCHALALLLGVPPRDIMAELYGKATGNVKGRGGSMHLFSDTMLGGHGIVSGQVPIGTGAAFTVKYLEQKQKLSVAFLGDGAVAQGVVHESLNIASVWGLPCMYIVENNKWGMGTHYTRALANAEHLVEKMAAAYGMKYYRLNGMDVAHCIGGFRDASKEVMSSSRPCLIECMTERFKGHSISDPGLYRTKDELKKVMEADPLLAFKTLLIQRGVVKTDAYTAMEKEVREIVLDAIRFAEESPDPDVSELGKDVFANETDATVKIYGSTKC